jgi:hypothetical protein
MIPLLYVALMSFSSSFIIGYSVTTEILRREFELSNIQPKNNSKVKFKPEIRFRTIPNRYNISENSLNELWYSRDDYETFKKKFLKFKANAEIGGLKKN